MKNPASKRGAALLCLAAAVSAHAQAGGDDVVIKPMSMVTQVDVGQVVKGYLDTEPVENVIIQRTSAWIIQELAIGSRLDVKVGVGGMFWYATPGEVPGGGIAYRAPMRFGPGIGRADMTYRFGDPAKPAVTLQAGYFPYKYNPDAKNLGEYLLRSGTYPGYLTTGGWNILSEAGYMMQGVRLATEFWDGRARVELLLPMERDMPPMGDVSPTLIASATPVRGIELGAGATCNHCLPVAPSKTSPKIRSTNGINYPSNAYIIDNPAFNSSLPATDLDGIVLATGAAGTVNPRYIYDDSRFYSFQGIKLMGRASVDPKAYVPMDFLAPQDLKVFAEVALLGVENQPFFYEKATERMPVMWGLNLPTRVAGYTVLDALSFQMEYYNSPNPNGVYYALRYRVPVPEMITYDPNSGFVSPTRDPNRFSRDHESITRDNWKWSVFARKDVYSGLRFYGQVASDHLRVPNFATQPSNYPITNRNNGKDWYYLVRFELGI